MRLTLRTLLAYLDDILEEGDTQTLRSKIQESSLATQLMDRIRNSVDNPRIGSHSPDAIGPLENANVMSEYLDSTLSPEQIAEIERLCLESDTSLAEAAACHQILTVVLGQPARVSDTLRQRVYGLPLSDALQRMERETQPSVDSPAMTSAAIAKPVASVGPSTPTTGATATTDSAAAPVAEAVSPVGPKDSGVSQAASRFRTDADELENQSEAEIVARTTRAMMAGHSADGATMRSARVVPWLITLAVVGVLVFALFQIFAPLSNRGGPVAMRDSGVDPNQIGTTDPEQPPTMIASNAADVARSSDPATTPATQTNPDGIGTPESSATESSATETPATAAPSVQTTPGAGSPAVATTADSEMGSAVKEPVVTPETSPPMTLPPIASAADENTDPVVVKELPETAALPTPEMTNPEPIPPADGPQEEQGDSSAKVAELAGAASLVLVQGSDGWLKLIEEPAPADPSAETVDKPTSETEKPGVAPPIPEPPSHFTTLVRSGQPIIAPALYRPILANDDGLEWTLAGPTRMRIVVDPTGAIRTELIDGRLLLASTRPDVTATLLIGPRLVEINMPEAQTELAIELEHYRPPGVDPLVPANRRPIYRIIVTQNRATLKSELVKSAIPPDAAANLQPDPVVELETRQQWQARGNQPTAVTTADRLPPWVDDAAQKNLPIESARTGLLEFFKKGEPVEKSMREAMAFRRIEVAALAAETLLLLDRADVYFGNDGILSRPRQRLFWTEHFLLLRQQIASSATAAASVRTAIQNAELADSDNLFQLLVGYTQDELIAGADAKLVGFLDSASMPVRVLAIENLKSIIGEDLGYRADQENANSRRSDIKKWDVRLRKGDIRYPS